MVHIEGIDKTLRPSKKNPTKSDDVEILNLFLDSAVCICNNEIYFGDILFPYSDYLNRNAELTKPGYVEEWWKLNLRNASKGEARVNPLDVSFEKAVELSELYKIPLHPELWAYLRAIARDRLDIEYWYRLRPAF